MRRPLVRRAGVGAALVALVGVLFVAAPDPARSDEPSVSKVLVVSGSSFAAVRWYRTASALLGAEFTLDLESCRRSNGRSCRGREGRVPPTVLDVVTAKGRGHDTLVVFGGYNESTSSLARGFDLVVEAARARGIRRIVWSTLRTNVDYISPRIQSFNAVFVTSNAMLRAKLATGRYPDVFLLDWDTYSTRETSWFVTDGVHFTVAGAWAAADYLSRKLAFLDARACPMPRRAGEEPQNPCPDPDLSPPDVDLVSLYPVDPAALHCYTLGTDGHIECRPDALVGQITRTLRYGMSGNEVRALQLRLAARGFLARSAVSKRFDARTFDALLSYQKRRGLTLSGVAGPSTRAALGFGCPEVGGLGSDCPEDSEPLRLLVPLRFRATGVRVEIVQARLAELGLYGYPVDGTYGSRTRAAVRAFQAREGLRQTGTINDATARALGFAPLP
jgi:hypothetical protein